jgi:hypothetical protein
MHKDLKAEAASPASPNFVAQQRRFDRWRHEYNHCRPHEALGMKKTADVYRRSAKIINENDLKVTYPAGYETKRISDSGFLSYEGRTYHVGEVFAGRTVGLFRNPSGRTELHYANVHLGNLHFDPEERFRPAASIVPPDRDKPRKNDTAQ